MRSRSTAFLFIVLLTLVCVLSPTAFAKGASERPGAAPGGVFGSDRTDYIAESFEGTFPPAGWSIIHLGDTNTWAQSSARARTGAYSAKIAYGAQGAPQDEYLVTSAIDMSTLTNAYLEFYEEENYWSSYGDHHYVGVSTTVPDNPAAFTFIATWTPSTHTIAGFEGDPVLLDLSAFAGEPVVYVCFRYTGDWADDWWIDDVRIYEPFDHDLALLEVLPDESSLNEPGELAPTALVKNIGKNAESFTVRVVITESETEVYDETLSGTLASVDDSLFVFPTIAINDGHYYRTEVSVDVAVDDDPGNNEDVVYNYTYTHPHVPLAHLHTNSGCTPCAQTEPYLDAYLDAVGDDLAVIRAHTWWPNSNDLLYRDNPAQADTFVSSYDADYTPHLWVDGVVDVGSTGADYAPALAGQLDVLSPMEVSMHWKPLSEKLMIVVDVLEPLRPDGDYRLMVAATEDSVYHPGGNGHNWHDQAFRYMYPSLDGLTVPHETGKYTYEVDTPLDPLAVGWNSEKVRFTTYVQERHTWRIWQACTARLLNLTGNFVLSPSVTSVERGSDFTIDIDITPRLIEVVGCELNVGFDNTVVRLDSVIPGSWFDDYWPEVFFYDYSADPPDPATQIHVASALLDAASNAAGLYATCHFTALAVGATELDFTVCKVRDEDNYELEFMHSLADSIYVTWIGTGLPADTPAPRFGLSAAPNPFNPTTAIEYAIPSAGRWRLDIYDVKGRLVRTLLDGERAVGAHSVSWDARDDAGNALCSGVYLARVSGAAGAATTRLVLLK